MRHAPQRHHRRSCDDSREMLPRPGLPGHVNHAVGHQGRDAVLTTVHPVIAPAWREAWATALGGARSAPLPCGWPPASTRRGRSRRPVRTPDGALPALHVPQRRRGHGARPWPTITRDAPGWGPLLAQHRLGSCLGRSLRDLQEVRPVPRGERRSLAACHRLVLTVQAPLSACQPPPGGSTTDRPRRWQGGHKRLSPGRDHRRCPGAAPPGAASTATGRADGAWGVAGGARGNRPRAACPG